MSQEFETGELIPEPYLTAADSPVKIGEEVIIRPPQRLQAWSADPLRLTGKIVNILPGYELTYVVEVYEKEGRSKGPLLQVRGRDIARVSW